MFGLPYICIHVGQLSIGKSMQDMHIGASVLVVMTIREKVRCVITLVMEVAAIVG